MGPRLPWAQALPAFKKDPKPIIGILELLKEDPSAYVRRSVANNLNDIAKDHPTLILDLAKRWWGSHPHTDWIVKHACRTLLKQCNPEALELFGLTQTTGISISQLEVSTPIHIGEEVVISFCVVNDSSTDTKLRIEYAIDFLKSRGSYSRKLFKLSEKNYQPGNSLIQTRHPFKQMTTRTHYAGEHFLTIIINGKEMGTKSLSLLQEG
jgi:hypothetical protein